MQDLKSEVATLDEVARVLGRSTGWLMRNWLKLAREEGFPRKHATGWTWPRGAVAAWLRTCRPSVAAPVAANDDHGWPLDAVAAHEAAYMDQLRAAYGVPS